MPEKLPKGWVKTKLGEVCLPVASIQPDDFPDAHFTYFDIGGIDNERNLIAETKIVTGRTAPSRARQLLRKNDILFSTVRTYLRKIALVEREYPNPVASTGFAVIRAAQGVSSNLLFFQVLSEDFLQPLHELQTGSSYPAVRAKDVFAQSIVVPPTAEQERLVAKLRPALSGVERAETATRRAQERLRRYRAAVLDAAVTGKLTRAWRESQLKDEKTDIEAGEHLLRGLLLTRRTLWEETELKRLSDNGKIPQNDQWKSKYPRPRGPITKSLPELPSEWIWASLEQVSTRVTVGYVGAMKNEYVRNGIPFLRSQNVRPNRFEAEGLVFIRRQFHTKLAKSTITPGDVVVVRSGVAVGTACVIPEKLGEANCSDLVLIQGPLIKPDFISFYMNSAARRHVELGKVGIAQPHFNTASVASLSVPLPPVAEQTEIVLQVKRRLAAADRLATTLDRQLERARATRQSLLQEAFAGRLVPQNSNDEPASVLLESIRAG
ncbi:MAG TPA: restriction endonuclease subunit S, partial [Candidatus Acidoferrum sp.]|nr:restriction endonuclease subunit S [Candidatus Acidoferrum sp.]